MADTNPAKAIETVKRIEMICDFFENAAIKKAIDDSIPFTGIVREAGALGFDTSIWVGLGIVGIWAALDAYSARAALRGTKCAICRRKCITTRYAKHAIGNEAAILAELEDFRHLYAHNYAGDADAAYFDNKKRHVLKQGTVAQLTCNAQFNGQRLHLQLPNLRFYSTSVRSMLERMTSASKATPAPPSS